MLKTAIEAAQAGSKVLLDSLRNGEQIQGIDRKSASDFVTEVDRRSQETIIELILRRFPHHAVMAEETGGGVSGREFRWIIDPLDGTTNFIHGFPVFAVSVAAERYEPGSGGFGPIEAGAVVNPVSGELFSAQMGKGAFRNGERISVSGRARLEDCIFATGFPFREKDYLEEFFRIFRNMFQAVSGIRRAGAAALDLCWTASGALDGFWEKGLSPWDLAAGCLIVAEAGGMVSDFEGGQNHLVSGNIVASTPEIHRRMLELIAK